MKPSTLSRRTLQSAFSLVEVMVAVVIALIGIIVIFQVLTLWDERKRTTSSGSDAQVAGTIALYALERDVRPAGFGFGLSNYMGCLVQAYDNQRATPAFTFRLYPVEIIDGASGAPDQIRVLYGTSMTVVGNQSFTTSTASTKKTSSRAGFNKGDLVVVGGNTTDCALVEITDNTNADSLSIDHATGTYVNYLSQTVTQRYNNPAGTGTTFSSGVLHNLGPGNVASGTTNVNIPRWDTWQINSNNALVWSDALHDASASFEVAEGIVDLQAEYGVDGNNDNMIGTAEWTNATPTDWTKVRAIRVGLLARSQQYEKLKVTATAPTWQGGAFTMNDLGGSSDTDPAGPANWRNYRYRVYEKTIPLRNIIWGTSP